MKNSLILASIAALGLFGAAIISSHPTSSKPSAYPSLATPTAAPAPATERIAAPLPMPRSLGMNEARQLGLELAQMEREITQSRLIERLNSGQATSLEIQQARQTFNHLTELRRQLVESRLASLGHQMEFVKANNSKRLSKLKKVFAQEGADL